MTRNVAKLATFLFVFLVPTLALAAGAETNGSERSIYGFAMALAVGLAALGGGMGQGRAVAAALELIRDLLAFVEAADARTLDSADVDERVLATGIRLDEAEALGGVEEFYGAIDGHDGPFR